MRPVGAVIVYSLPRNLENVVLLGPMYLLLNYLEDMNREYKQGEYYSLNKEQSPQKVIGSLVNIFIYFNLLCIKRK